MSLQLNAPQPLAATHNLDEFECGEAVLDEWLKRRAMTNQMSGASRTPVSERCWYMRFTTEPRSSTNTMVFSRRRCIR